MWYNESRMEWLGRLHDDLVSEEEILKWRRQLVREIQELDQQLEEARTNREEQATAETEARFRGVEWDLIQAYEETCIVDKTLEEKGWLVCDGLAKEMADWNGKLFE